MKTLIFTIAALVAFNFQVTGQDAHPHITGEIFIVTAGGDNKVLGRVEIAAYKPDEVTAAFKVVDDQITATQRVMSDLADKTEKAEEESQKTLLDALSLDEQQEILNEVIAGQYGGIKGLADGLPGEDEKVKALASNYLDAHNAFENANLVSEYTKGACKYYAHLPTPIASVKTDSQGKYDLQLPSSDPVILAAHTTRQTGENVEDYFWIVKCDPKKSAEMTLSNDNLASSGSQDSVVKTSGVEWLGEQGMPIFEASIAKAKEQAKEAEEKARKTLMDQYRANPSIAENEAIRQYPDLGKAGTALNKEFTTRYKLYKTSNPSFFDEPDWPIRLAKECAESLPAK